MAVYRRIRRGMDYDYTHPERHHKGLFLYDSGMTDEELEDKLKEQSFDYKNRNKLGFFTEDKDLCWVCGWTDTDELWSSYGSRVKIYHTRGATGVWTIGSEWLLRDSPNDDAQGNDYMTQEFLRQQPGLSVPLIKEMRRLSPPTAQIHFTLMSRAQGDCLADVWSDLSAEQKASYSRQLAACIRQLRQFTAPKAMKVDGSQLDDLVIAHCPTRRPPTCKKIGFTNDEWFDGIADELRAGLAQRFDLDDAAVIETKLQELRDNLPASEPYTLTHGDLNLSNIIVKDGRIEAIIDWEYAGYYPWWVERMFSFLNNDRRVVEVFGPVWAELCPDMSRDAFKAKIGTPVQEICAAWNWCPTEHEHIDRKWFRPQFCKCQPYAGSFKWSAVGGKIGHKIREVKPKRPRGNDKYESLESVIELVEKWRREWRAEKGKEVEKGGEVAQPPH